MRRTVFFRLSIVMIAAVTGFFTAGEWIKSCVTTLRNADRGSLLLQESLPDHKEIVLPYNIDGTGLIALAMISYEGTFLEDGSGAEVVNISALLLRNNSGRQIHDAQIHVWQKERVLLFEVTHLPSGENVLALEKGRQTFMGNSILRCSAVASYEDKDDWKQCFSFANPDKRSLSVVNVTDNPIRNISLYYKTHYAPANFYVGGATNAVLIDVLRPGEEVLLLPHAYSVEGSKVVWVCYDDQ